MLKARDETIVPVAVMMGRAKTDVAGLPLFSWFFISGFERLGLATLYLTEKYFRWFLRRRLADDSIPDSYPYTETAPTV